MSNPLPPRRGPESLRKEAKRWLAELRANDTSARERFQRALANPPSTPTLRDVQLALAREHGFAGWRDLLHAIGSSGAEVARVLAEYERRVEALLDAYYSGTPEALERHYQYTWHRRAWHAMRTYAQLDAGKRPGPDVELSKDDARYLVARDHGFETWAALEAATRQTPTVRTRPPGATRDMTDEALDLFDNVEQIERLDFSGARGITDEALRKLARFPSLRVLDLSGTSITDDGARHLAKCRELRELNLSFTNTGDEPVRALAGMPHLTHLWTGQRFTDAGVPLLHDIPAFRQWGGTPGRAAFFDQRVTPNQLTLRGELTDRGMDRLRGLDGLYALDIDASLPLTAESMLAVGALPNLGQLQCDPRDDWMRVIARMPSLRYLGIQDTVAGDDGFEALGESRTIEYIWGRRCHGLGTRGFRALSRMPALRGLSVSCLNVRDEGIAALPDFPSLVELMPMDIPDAGYRHIARCAQLESLILMYCRDTTDAATEYVVGLPKLSYYFNSYTTITDRTPELLSTMNTLERITLDGCHNLTNAGVARLARLPRLREIRVAGRGLTPDVVAAFPPTTEVVFSL